MWAGWVAICNANDNTAYRTKTRTQTEVPANGPGHQTEERARKNRRKRIVVCRDSTRNDPLSSSFFFFVARLSYQAPFDWPDKIVCRVCHLVTTLYERNSVNDTNLFRNRIFSISINCRKCSLKEKFLNTKVYKIRIYIHYKILSSSFSRLNIV